MPSKTAKKIDKKHLTRSSPPYHAKDYPNQIKKGNDKKDYISQKDKNGVFKWKKVNPNQPLEDAKKNDGKVIYFQGTEFISRNGKWQKLKWYKNIDKYYQQFSTYSKPSYDISKINEKIDNLKNDLKKINIKLFYNKWSKRYGDFEIEYVIEDIFEKYGQSINWLIFTEKKIYWGARTGEIWIQHHLHKKQYSEVNKLLKKYFNTQGAIKINKAILIKLKKL